MISEVYCSVCQRYHHNHGIFPLCLEQTQQDHIDRARFLSSIASMGIRKSEPPVIIHSEWILAAEAVDRAWENNSI